VERPTKQYGIYHWDTFEEGPEATTLVGEADTLSEACAFTATHYKLDENGADVIEIVNRDSRNVILRFKIG